MNQRAPGDRTRAPTDKDRAHAAPESYFSHPRDVLALEDCTDEEKIAILLNWQRALIQLQTASEENMLPDKPGRSKCTRSPSHSETRSNRLPRSRASRSATLFAFLCVR